MGRGMGMGMELWRCWLLLLQSNFRCCYVFDTYKVVTAFALAFLTSATAQAAHKTHTAPKHKYKPETQTQTHNVERPDQFTKCVSKPSPRNTLCHSECHPVPIDEVSS